MLRIKMQFKRAIMKCLLETNSCGVNLVNKNLFFRHLSILCDKGQTTYLKDQ